MPQTPLTAATPYCAAADFIEYHDRDQVADWLRDGPGPRPSRAAMLDATNKAGLRLTKLLLAASGEVEAACLVGKRYTPEDLQALTGAGKEYLQKLTADLAFWRLAQRRTPGSADPEAVPGARQAEETLKLLRGGERIFSFQESAEAGLPSVKEPKPSDPFVRNGVVHQARRYFGVRGRDRTGGDC